MDQQQVKAFRAIVAVVEDEGKILVEQHLADAIGVRNSEAVALIDWLASQDYVELGDPPNTLGSRSTRAVWDLTHKGREWLEDNPQ